MSDQRTGSEVPLPRDEDGNSFPDDDSTSDLDEADVIGEPVETDAGWVTPQQQNVGAGRTASTANRDQT